MGAAGSAIIPEEDEDEEDDGGYEQLEDIGVDKTTLNPSSRTLSHQVNPYSTILRIKKKKINKERKYFIRITIKMKEIGAVSTSKLFGAVQNNLSQNNAVNTIQCENDNLFRKERENVVLNMRKE